jgi:hypothetical protein
MTETNELQLSPERRRFVGRGAALGGTLGVTTMELHYHLGHLHDIFLRVIGDIGIGMAGTALGVAASLAIFEEIVAHGPDPGVAAEINHQHANRG